MISVNSSSPSRHRRGFSMLGLFISPLCRPPQHLPVARQTGLGDGRRLYYSMPGCASLRRCCAKQGWSMPCRCPASRHGALPLLCLALPRVAPHHSAVAMLGPAPPYVALPLPLPSRAPRCVAVAVRYRTNCTGPCCAVPCRCWAGQGTAAPCRCCATQCGPLRHSAVAAPGGTLLCRCHAALNVASQCRCRARRRVSLPSLCLFHHVLEAPPTCRAPLAHPEQRPVL